MKRKNTLWSLVLALVMVLGVFAPLSALADNANEPGETKDITVNVHKILMSKDDLDKHDVNKTYKPNKGIANITDFFGASAKRIEGVYFVALKEGHDNYDNFESLTKEQQKTVVDGVAANMKGLTGTNGQLKLTLQSPGKYKIYEVKSMSTYSGATEKDKAMLAEQKAVPVVLDLPDHARYEGGIADEIHVYPKNTEDKPTVDKFVVNKEGKDVKEASFDKDEEHTWAIPATIPTGFKDYEVFKLTDVIDSRLSYKAGQKVKVTVPEKTDITLEENKDYKVTAPTEEKGGTLVIEFTKAGIQKLAAAEGLKVRATFVTTINDDADMSVNIPNDVTLEYGHNPDSTGKTNPGEKPRVYTGGKKFIKIDSSQADKALKDAKFVVQRGKDEYLVEKDGKYSWKKIPNAKPADLAKDTELKKLTSGEDGTFEITGLKYDRPNGTKYKIVEVEAPKDYALLDNPIEFTVNDKSYTETFPQGDAAPVPAAPQKVDNKPLTIPQTGGMGTMIFLVAGLALMGGAFIAMRKRSAEQA
ncbi:MAG: SpaH/EbpB family LPXTG-anchored major pilin [Aedoeadaptatus pacaensis]